MDEHKIKDKLLDIKMRLQGTTPAPWRWADWGTDFGRIEPAEPEFRLDLEHCPGHGGSDEPRLHARETNCSKVLAIEDPLNNEADRLFIAHSRQDVEDLIQMVEFLLIHQKG